MLGVVTDRYITSGLTGLLFVPGAHGSGYEFFCTMPRLPFVNVPSLTEFIILGTQ
jgi:hypothetical protein